MMQSEVAPLGHQDYNVGFISSEWEAFEQINTQ